MHPDDIEPDPGDADINSAWAFIYEGHTRHYMTESFPKQFVPHDSALIDSIEATYAECAEIARKKNADYAGAGDPFANFKAAPALLSGISVEKGILVRLTDKIKRIDNLLTHDAYVTDESMDDTIKDAINYLAILRAYRKTQMI